MERGTILQCQNTGKKFVVKWVNADGSVELQALKCKTDYRIFDNAREVETFFEKRGRAHNGRLIEPDRQTP